MKTPPSTKERREDDGVVLMVKLCCIVLFVCLMVLGHAYIIKRDEISALRNKETAFVKDIAGHPAQIEVTFRQKDGWTQETLVYKLAQ